MVSIQLSAISEIWLPPSPPIGLCSDVPSASPFLTPCKQHPKLILYAPHSALFSSPPDTLCICALSSRRQATREPTFYSLPYAQYLERACCHCICLVKDPHPPARLSISPLIHPNIYPFSRCCPWSQHHAGCSADGNRNIHGLCSQRDESQQMCVHRIQSYVWS